MKLEDFLRGCLTNRKNPNYSGTRAELEIHQRNGGPTLKTKATKQPKSLSDQVFSHPVRKFNADELKKIVGGNFTGPQPGFKSTSSVDNQGRSFN